MRIINIIVISLVHVLSYVNSMAQKSSPHFFNQDVKYSYERKVLPFVALQLDSIERLHHAASHAVNQHDTTKAFRIYLELAKKYSNISQNDSSLFYLNRAEKYCNADDMAQAQFWNLVNQKISTYYRLGEYNTGLNYGYSILKQTQVDNPESSDMALGKAKLLGNIFNFFVATKQFDIAKDYIKQMGKIVAQYNDTSLLVVYAMLKGILNAELPNADLQSALKYFNEAKSLSMAKGLHDQALRSYINIAVTYYKTAQYDLAQKALQEGLSLTDVRYPYPILAAYSTMGEIFLKNGKFALAEQYLKVAIEGAEQFDLKEIAFYAYNYMYQVAKEQNNHKASLFYFEKYQDLKSQLENKELTKELSEMEMKYQTAAKDKEIVTKSLQLEQQENRFKNYAMLTIVLLLLLLAIVAWLRIRNLKQNTRILGLQQEQKINTLKAIIQGEEQERMRVAGDLHDGIGAMVAAIKMDVQRLSVHQQQTDELKTIKNNLENTSREIREVAHNLLPNTLNQYSLKEALLFHCDKISRSHNIDISLQYEDDISDPENDIKLTIYRIFQELLQNIVKHAQANRAYIQVREKAGKLRITVEDNGIGFDPEKVKMGLGLSNIKLRAMALNGSVEMDARPGSGSTFFISLDYKV